MNAAVQTSQAVELFSALAQTTRIEALRLLIAHEPHGLPAGETARRLAVPQNTLSTHLSVLERAGLVTSERHGRSIIYRARLDAVRELTSYLISNCCGGHPELCAPSIAEFTQCRSPKEGANVC